MCNQDAIRLNVSEPYDPSYLYDCILYVSNVFYTIYIYTSLMTAFIKEDTQTPIKLKKRDIWKKKMHEVTFLYLEVKYMFIFCVEVSLLIFLISRRN